jgi:hypothetical protein
MQWWLVREVVFQGLCEAYDGGLRLMSQMFDAGLNAGLLALLLGTHAIQTAGALDAGNNR